mmetsp:Transcript_2213/g.5233  ORF Transcript_2213/g.5233 Transcript_2213/m.5233 type:complete len:167 (+) Transcript_2213:625-1125(+)
MLRKAPRPRPPRAQLLERTAPEDRLGRAPSEFRTITNMRVGLKKPQNPHSVLLGVPRPHSGSVADPRQVMPAAVLQQPPEMMRMSTILGCLALRMLTTSEELVSAWAHQLPAQKPCTAPGRLRHPGVRVFRDAVMAKEKQPFLHSERASRPRTPPQEAPLLKGHQS